MLGISSGMGVSMQDGQWNVGLGITNGMGVSMEDGQWNGV